MNKTCNSLALYTTFLAIAALLLASCSGSPEPVPPVNADLTRQTTAGKVAGFRQEGVNQWRGIPFAQPPVGELRWRAPRPAEAWDEVRPANEFGSICSQVGHPLGSGDSSQIGQLIGSEDCLYLNIYAPENSTGPLPVLFWIHGGGNQLGSSSQYDFSVLAKREQVVVVSSNYRLGIFGWFSHPSLRADATSASDASANFGLLDLVSALIWTSDNIATFGGDPSRVTMFGESAGATDVLALMAGTSVQDLVRGAIAQSGGTRSVSSELAEMTELNEDRLLGSGWLESVWQKDHPQEDFDIDITAIKAEITKRTGDPLIEDPDAEQALIKTTWLRSLSAEYIFSTLDPGDESGIPPNLPIIIEDDLVVPQGGTAEAFAQNRQLKIPLILGTNRDESKLFLALNEELVSSWFGIQYFLNDEDLYERASYYSSQAWKVSGADGIANAMQAPAWVYRFDWDEEPTLMLTDFSQIFGAAHAFEIPFVSGSMSLSERIDPSIFSDENLPTARRLAQRMMSYWGAFARNGVPGTGDGDQPHWPPYRISKSFMVFDTDQDGGLRLEYDRDNLSGLLAELAADTSVANDQERCTHAWDILRFTNSATAQVREKYYSWNNGQCAQVEPGSYGTE